MENGICALGIAPKLYGVVENIDINQALPHLSHFNVDKTPPSAIILEYIPNMKEIWWETYDKKRMQRFREAIIKIHEALVYHGDTHPRNMLWLEDEPERVIYIDFDRAEVYDDEHDGRAKEDFARETRRVDGIAEIMVGNSIGSLPLNFVVYLH